MADAKLCQSVRKILRFNTRRGLRSLDQVTRPGFPSLLVCPVQDLPAGFR